ncbi:MAG: hypothetical protein Fur0041_20340 [Bacteroidia bacterium]
MFSPRMIFAVSAILIAAATRFIPHPPNFTAVGAIALFAGAVIPSRFWSMVIPFVAMFLTDLVYGFHSTMWAVYASFAMITMMGWAIQNKQNAVNMLGASLAASVLFFFLTNTAVWMADVTSPVSFYSKDLSGLMLCIDAGIPFFANTLISQLLFGGLLFGSYYALKVWKPALVKA